MKTQLTLSIATLATLVTVSAAAQEATLMAAAAPVVQPWMNTEVGDAWKQGYQGQGVTVTVVDDFNSRSVFRGNLSAKSEVFRHGQWTYKETSLIAPSATMLSQDYRSGKKVTLNQGLNVINLSYGMLAPAGYTKVGWSAQETSVIDYARKGTAIISKAAGNDSGVAVGAKTKAGQIDYLGRDLIGAQSAIFVGALSSNGTLTAPAKLATYSNVAGTNVAVQKQFLVVGVSSGSTGLQGTSFAAPIISGYAAILGSKFTKSTPTQITNQLLSTARTDTISGYNAAIHGRGEATIARALAPVSIK